LETFFTFREHLNFMIMSVFSKTVSVAGFAVSNGITDIKFIERVNKDTGVVTNFISCLDEHGARLMTLRVAKDIPEDLSGDLSVSWFQPEDGGEASWMLHRTGQSSVVEKGSLSFAPAKKSADMSI
jgi:hypothetical protein